MSHVPLPREAEGDHPAPTPVCTKDTPSEAEVDAPLSRKKQKKQILKAKRSQKKTEERQQALASPTDSKPSSRVDTKISAFVKAIQNGMPNWASWLANLSSASEGARASPLTLGALFPQKYERHGRVVVLRLNSGQTLDFFPSPLFPQCFAASFLPIEVQVVLLDQTGITGELRKPELVLLYPVEGVDPPEAVAKALNFSREKAPQMLRRAWKQRAQVKTVASFLPASFVDRAVASECALEALIASHVYNSLTYTIHVENKITYAFDVQSVMFSSGNTTERMHFSTISAEDEVVVDMFCGIGYFSLPLAVHGKPRVLYGLDKNPDSVAFIRLNALLNGVNHLIEPLCGDNRETGLHIVGKCDRVLMGYLPCCTSHLSRALQFLKRLDVSSLDSTSDEASSRPVGMIHYHFLAPALDPESALWKEWEEGLGTALVRTMRDEKHFSLVDLRRVKSYSPKLYHYVGDVKLN